MNLQDVVRDQTRAVLDLLKGDESKLAELRRQKESVEERERRAKQEATDIQRTVAEHLETVETLRIRVRELADQVAELQERLRRRQKELQLAEDEHGTVERSYTDKQKDAARARREAAEYAREIDEAAEHEKNHAERLQRERRTAFQKYLSELWKRLREAETIAQASNEALAALKSLEQARHDDPEVADLWETRQEWQQIAQAAGPQRVRETASREVEQVEEELNRRFPGALTAASSVSVLDELEEVFMYPRGTGDGYLLALPIPLEISESLDAGRTEIEQDLAVRVIWGFERGVEKKVEGGRGSLSRFQIHHGFLFMLVEETPRDIQNREPIALTLAGGGRVSFIVSELPQDIRGALCDESFNG